MRTALVFHAIKPLAACLLAIGFSLAVATPAQAQTDNEAQQSMLEATIAMCPTLGLRRGSAQRAPGEDDLNDFCDALVTGQFADTNSVLQRVNGEEMQAVQRQAVRSSDVSVGQVMSRMAAVRSGEATGAGISIAGLEVQVGDEVLMGAAADDRLGADGALLPTLDWSKLGIFMTGGVRFGDKDETSQSGAFSFDTRGVTVGADYRLADDLVVGAAIGYTNFDVDFKITSEQLAGQDLSSDAVTFAAFGTYFPYERFFIDGILTFGWSSYDSKRRILAEDNPDMEDEVEGIDAIAKGEFDSFFYGITAKAGYETRLIGQLRLIPSLQIDYVNADIDGFSEKSSDQRADAISLSFSSQEAESVRTRLGAELSHGLETPVGLFVPSVRAAYIHEYLGAQEGVRIRYKADPTALSEFELPTDPWDRHFGELGANLTAARLPFGLTAAVDYATVVGLQDFDIHAINLSLRKAFGPY